jgi:hypothetical protein
LPIQITADGCANPVYRLTPHETPWTDVVLLGHSMGGLLAADIALLFRHNIIGVINFDVPFLGMHPGIVKAGLASIFNKPSTPNESSSGEPVSNRPSRMDTFFAPRPSDPNYNPPFPNDVNLPARKGWANALHFVNKHSKDLIQASRGLVKSHLDFGGAMADYPELKDRYARIRALEEDNEEKRQSANPEVRSPPRIRFVNYYTASTGRPKKPKPLKSPSPSRPPSRGPERLTIETANHDSQSQERLTVETASLDSESQPSSPQTSTEEELVSISPRMLAEDDLTPISPQEPLSAGTPIQEPSHFDTPRDVEGPPELPDIPPIPREPPFVDLAQFNTKEERRAAEKEHTGALREYQRAVKARNTVIKERAKIEERWRKQKKKQGSGALKEEKVEASHETKQIEEDLAALRLGEASQSQIPATTEPYGSYDFSQSTILSQPTPDDRTADKTGPASQSPHDDPAYSLMTRDTNDWADHDENTAPAAKKRYKKFCMLPPKDAQGNKDPTWVSVFMENMDEVVAHTSLFIMGDTYERLVGEVGARIEDWVRELDSLRLVREMEGMT